MSESTKVLSFEAFRAAANAPFAEVVRQQREFFRDGSAAQALLAPKGSGLGGWAEWPDSVSLADWTIWADAHAPLRSES